MAPEKDTYDACDGSGGLDALLAAITGEPLSPEARADAAFMAEHRSAAADVALLREQLTLLGETLAPEHAAEHPAAEAAARTTVPVRQPVPLRERHAVRRLRAVALGVAAVAAAGALVTGGGWLLTHAAGGADDAASSAAVDQGGGEDTRGGGDSGYPSFPGVSDAGGGGALAYPEYLACARLIVEGTVTAVETGPGAGQDRITLRVTRYYKPDKGPAEVRFVMDQESGPRLAAGDHAMIEIGQGEASPGIWATDEKEIAAQRDWITGALPKSRSLTCD
ncbi:hypothetical protein RB628_10945 [Streptomyces sp. ADMS]|uniref:hypothetical protein n=1 Tax=Streptomyces sp. ADMS TaxID=3071415 RepID=UPI00296F6D96|nr:hypothetical protein [Streptomyces sp. ADMS]MDW4905835.1 hypothetical protein [Streptomyces sp. ADMS]